DDGLTVTFDRQVALHRYDVAFLTWFHPLLAASNDAVLEGHYGKTAAAVARVPGVESGALLLEALYRVTASAPRELQLQRFLPCTTLRVLVDLDGHEFGDRLALEELGALLEPVDRGRLAPLLAERREDIGELAAHARAAAQARLPEVVRRSTAAMLETLTD